MGRNNFNFGLSNYRVFDQEQKFDFSPITMLVGPNNSGKSSAMKALFLLKESLKNDNLPLELNFNWTENQLSSFLDLVNDPSEPIVFSFEIQSELFGSGSIYLSYSAGLNEEKKFSQQLSPTLKSVKVVFENVTFLEFDFNPHIIFNLKFDLHLFYQTIINRLDTIEKLMTKNNWNEIVMYDTFKDAGFLGRKTQAERNVLFDEIIATKDYQLYKKDFVNTTNYDASIRDPKHRFNFESVSKGLRSIFHLLEDETQSNDTISQTEYAKMELNSLKSFQSKFNSKYKEDTKNDTEVKRKGESMTPRIEDFLGPQKDSFSNLIDDVYEILNEKIVEFSKTLVNSPRFSDFELDNSKFGVYVLEWVLAREVKFLGINIPKQLSKLEKIPSVKANRSRYFDLKEDNTFLAKSLRGYIEAVTWKIDAYPEIRGRLDSYVNLWLQEFGIGEKLKLNPSEAAFENEVVALYVLDINDKPTNVANMGTGVAQVISLILAPFQFLEIDNQRISGASIIYLEEPESNLHPDWQSKLVSLIVYINKEFGTSFVIETHSEYMIRKLQYLTASKDSKLGKDDSVIYYLNTPNAILENGDKKVKKINIDEMGNLSADFGKGFYDEAINLKFDLLRLNKTQQN